ncbi:Uncharacterised protein [Mycobacteroides abscessus subsp. abscessus]|nr:Uncharacterised protein [Mycobacteroides abscessus subsp. abscessus]
MSAVAVRMNSFTGVLHLIISSIAVGIRAGFALRRASSPGFWISACSPPEMASLVVSWPALATIT